jgi:hypothetical protein
MITPDHSEQPRSRDPRGSQAMALALVAVLAVGLTLVGLTSPDPAASEATTSTSTSTTLAEVEPPFDLETFTADQLTRGEPFEWENTLSVVEGFPVALLRHNELLYVFATDMPNFSGFDSGGLRAWRSSDGLTWEPLGQVIEQRHRIGVVSSTSQGLVALETGSGAGFTVWTSGNGENWETEEITLEKASDLITVSPQAVGGTDRLLIVAGQIDVDVFPVLKEKLGEVARFGWGTDVVAGEVMFTLYGPLGMPIAAIPAEDLSLTEQDMELIADAYSAESDLEVDLWVRDGESAWKRTQLPGLHWVQGITMTPYGDAIAHGWGNAGRSSWTSRDGLNWERTPFTSRHYLDERWGDMLVAPTSESGLSIYTSPAGGEWNDIGPTEHYPSQIQWWFGAVAAGPGGVAARVNGWDEIPPLEPTRSEELPTLSGDDGTLTIDIYSGEYRLEQGDQVHGWTAVSGVPAGIDVDLETATVHFLDRESGGVLASFQIEDIMQAQQDFLDAEQDPQANDFATFAFTSDGTDWTVQSIDDIGSANNATQLAVTDTHVIATEWAYEGFYNPSSPPGFKVWTAVIP